MIGEIAFWLQIIAYLVSTLSKKLFFGINMVASVFFTIYAYTIHDLVFIKINAFIFLMCLINYIKIKYQ